MVIWRTLRSIYEFVVFYLGLGLLGVGCLAWSLAAAGLYPLLPRHAALRLGRATIMGGFRLYLTLLEHIGACRFDLAELDGLRAAGPLIVAPNHPCLLDAVMVLSRLPNLACIMKASLFDNVFLGAGARLARYIRNDSLLGMAVLAVNELRSGGQLLVFPEGTRTTALPVSTFRGTFTVLASRARVPVQAVFIETDSPYLCKGWPLFRKPPLPISYRVRLGQRFDPVTDFQTFTKELEAYYAAELADSPMNGALAGALRELEREQ